jgi:hypothetical protein
MSLLNSDVKPGPIVAMVYACLGGCGEVFFTGQERRKGIGICSVCKARNRKSARTKTWDRNSNSSNRAGRNVRAS